MEVYAIIKLAMENGKVGIKPCSEVIEKLVVEKKKEKEKENRSRKFPWWQCLGQMKST